MIQFLYQGGHGSHGPRATALSGVTPASRVGDIATAAPAKVPGLDTIAFWGHGDSFRLCGKTARELHDLLKNWKKLNPGLKTVELITCNSRHSTMGDPYANQLKSTIGFGSSLKGLKIKALPTSVAGTKNAWSILLAETNFNSWVYITAPGADDKELMKAVGLIEFQKNATGGLVSYKGDIAVRAGEAVKEHTVRNWTMNYGYLNTLRAHLGIVASV